jgi:hypothetical protein
VFTKGGRIDLLTAENPSGALFGDHAPSIMQVHASNCSHLQLAKRDDVRIYSSLKDAYRAGLDRCEQCIGVSKR